MKIALLGPEGTYTHMAAEEMVGREYEFVFCRSVEDALERYNSVIPFENSLAGTVGQAVDLLKERDNRYIVEEKVLDIDHVLASQEDNLEDVEEVVSHPKALGQCRDIISDHDWKEVESSSTARAAREIGEGQAAICSEKAAEINGLNILKRSVQDKRNNSTRFLRIGDEIVKEGSKTAMVLLPEGDRPGLLSSMLSCFSGHGVNLSYIQSRPRKNGLGNYFFFVEAEESLENTNLKKALRCLETYCDVEILGCY